MTSEAKKDENRAKAEIVSTFQKLRNEQRQLVLKLDEFQADLLDHRKVLEALKTIDEERRCYRMVGEVLCEQTVKDVKPILQTNIDNFVKLIEDTEKKVVGKGKEINSFREKHNIVIQNQINSLKPINETPSSSK